MDSLTYRLSRNVTFSRVGRPNLFYVWLRGHTVRLEARRVLAQTLGSTSRVIVNRRRGESRSVAQAEIVKAIQISPRGSEGRPCLLRGIPWATLGVTADRLAAG